MFIGCRSISARRVPEARDLTAVIRTHILRACLGIGGLGLCDSQARCFC